MITDSKIREVMKTLVEECRDGRTGEVNCTLLAENAAGIMNLYEGEDFEIPERVFDLATEFE